MARQIRYTVGVINITVHPHSPEIYTSLFRDAFTENPPTPWRYHGNELVAIRALDFNNDEQQYICGTILKFTQIGDGKWYDSYRGISLENDEDKPQIDIKNLHPNLIDTVFCFFPQGHRLYIVTHHKKFGISRICLELLRKIIACFLSGLAGPREERGPLLPLNDRNRKKQSKF